MNRLLRASALWMLTLLLAAGSSQAAPANWMITLLEGDAVVTEGTQRSQAQAGQPLGRGALIETGERTTLLRLEGPDASSIDLGPASRVMLLPPAGATRGARPATLYVLRGWVKVSLRGRGAASDTTQTTLVAPALAVKLSAGGATGAWVMRVSAEQQHSLFAESAAVDVQDRRGAKPLHRLAAGQFFQADGRSAGSVSARPEPEWLKSMPRPFRDPLPMRAAALKDQAPKPLPLPAPRYEDLAHWLGAEPDLRRDMVQRFAPLLRDAAFSRAVQQHLSAHPEWAPLFKPKDPP